MSRIFEEQEQGEGTRALGMASAKVHAEIVLAMALVSVLETDWMLECARDQGYLGWLLLRYLRRFCDGSDEESEMVIAMGTARVILREFLQRIGFGI